MERRKGQSSSDAIASVATRPRRGRRREYDDDQLLHLMAELIVRGLAVGRSGGVDAAAREVALVASGQSVEATAKRLTRAYKSRRADLEAAAGSDWEASKRRWLATRKGPARWLLPRTPEAWLQAIPPRHRSVMAPGRIDDPRRRLECALLRQLGRVATHLADLAERPRLRHGAPWPDPLAETAKVLLDAAHRLDHQLRPRRTKVGN